MKALLLLAMVFSLCKVHPAFADKRVALVIGNSAYQNVTPLENPANDAVLMAETLKDLGFLITGNRAQLNLDKQHLDQAVQEFGKQLQGADVGLFYYAGHGVQVRAANFLVPTNANPTREADLDFQMVNVDTVLRQMEGTHLNIVILDACRNNPFGGRGLRASGGGLAQVQAPDGTLISYATQPGNVAQDGSDGHSPYTAALAAALKRPGYDLFKTFNEVGLSVKKATGGSQQPWVSSSPINGDFYFSESKAAAAERKPAEDKRAAPSTTTSTTPGTTTSRQSGSKEAMLHVGAYTMGEIGRNIAYGFSGRYMITATDDGALVYNGKKANGWEVAAIASPNRPYTVTVKLRSAIAAWDGHAVGGGLTFGYKPPKGKEDARFYAALIADRNLVIYEYDGNKFLQLATATLSPPEGEFDTLRIRVLDNAFSVSVNGEGSIPHNVDEPLTGEYGTVVSGGGRVTFRDLEIQ